MKQKKPTYPPTPESYQTSPSPIPRRKRQSALKTLYSSLYHATFALFILIVASLLVGSAYGLGQQAVRTGGQRRWNLFVLIAAYVALVLSSITHVWSRIISIRKILRSMPKPYMPTKQIDLPKKVADHIMTEYSRTAVIAHISQATTGHQEGWGRPGTKWENQHFRTYILSTLPHMRKALNPNDTSPPLSLTSLKDPQTGISDNTTLKVFINSYTRIIERARYARQEPSESDAAACEKILEVVLVTLEVKREREEREHGRRESLPAGHKSDPGV